MPLAEFGDNFANFTDNSWAVNGLSAASNKVSATVGGTWGEVELAHGVQSEQATIVGELIPDKTDTSGRFIFFGQMRDHATQNGTGAAYIAGTGICAVAVASQVINGTPHVAVPDADLVTGERYFVAVTYRPRGSASPGDWETIVQVYNKDMVFIGGERETGTSSSFATFDFVGIGGTSSTSTVARFGFTPGYFPGPAVRDYFRAPSAIRRDVGLFGVGDANRQFGIYVPGAVTTTPKVVALMFHGTGSWSAQYHLGNTAGTDWDRQTPNRSSNAGLGFLNAGLPVISPSSYSDGSSDTNNWGETSAYEEAKTIIEWIRAQLGSDTKLLLYGFSMGGLLALRLVAEGEVDGIEGVYLQNPVTGLFAAWDDSSFNLDFEASWGTAYASDADAHTALDPFDPPLLIEKYPARWAGKHIVISSSLEDPTVDATVYSDVLSTALTAASIPHTHIQRAFGGHLDAGHPGDIGDFIAGALRRGDTLELATLEGKILKPVDGIPYDSFNETILAWLSGQSVLVDNGDGTKTLTYKKQDGTTDKLAITYNNSGEWQSTVIT
jgi:pimeloyl-ACP methyl ester carboxylesterase